MCGICGYISKNRIDAKTLELMRDTIIYRGPNDAGIWQGEGNQVFVGLAHRRLSILDLSELGHQPMSSNDGNVIISYNGEIYNFLDLKEELIKDGYSFKSTCDTEVILASYQKWGTNCFSHFNGMFGIALWDKNNEELILSRDRMGKKPVYYYWNKETGDFVFASELKPVMQYPYFRKEIRHDMIGEFLSNKYICSPNTIFYDTYKLQPGQFLTYSKGEVKLKSYWDVVDTYRSQSKNIITDYKEALKTLDDLLKDSVARRMIADVPVGTFLSGGIDSSLVTAIAAQQSSQPIKTFSIGFNDKERNEAPYAKAIADYLGTDHTELYVDDETIQDLLLDLPTYYDEPFSDSSQLPMMLVSKLASDEVVVALSGDGGDELFCGYKMYDLAYIAQKVDWIGNILYHVPGRNMWVKRTSPEVRALINNRNQSYKTQLFEDVTIEIARSLLCGNADFCGKHNSEGKTAFSNNWQTRRMLLDMMSYLPDEVLAKADRASMKYSLEVRCPILDYRFVEASMRIPQKYKYHSFDKKHILKDLTYQYVPKNLLDRPKKGFGVPMRKWLRTSLKDNVERLSDKDILEKQGIFNPAAVRMLIDSQSKIDKIQYTSTLWSYYVFQRWYQQYIEDFWNK